VLAAMLLPALGKARESARTLQCLNNFRQVVLGMHTFADEHDGRAPGGANWSGGWISWDAVMNNLVYDKNMVQMYAHDGVIPGKFMCPNSGYLEGTYDRVQIMNSIANSEHKLIVPKEQNPSFVPATADYFLGTRFSRFRNASRKFLVMDSEYGSHTAKHSWPYTMVPAYSGSGAIKADNTRFIFRHAGANFSTAKVAAGSVDGHVGTYGFDEQDLNTADRWETD
jgi:hypothetical protein